jgi:hypothetical protein
MLRAFAEWEPRLGSPTEVEIKHGQHIQTCTVMREEQRAMARGTEPETESVTRYPPLHLALVYKRNAEPDGALLTKLEGWLRAGGHHVFIDRHMSIGVEWAQEIERRLREADAVIALLSDRAGDSETMLYEMQVACDEQGKRRKPAILPVRIGSDEPLTGEIGRLIARFHYFHWRDDGDDERLWQEIETALHRPEDPPDEMAASLEQPGGAVPLDSPFYIERPTDAQFHEAIARGDSIVLLKGARQMGKTSLLARGLQTAREQGWSVTLTDFQTFSSSQLDTDERLYKSLMHALKTQLNLDVELEWNDWLGANANLEQFIATQILPAINGHLVWAMDEVDRLFSRPYATDFFGIVRSWHNRRALEPGGAWQKLTIAIAYATEAHLFITDLNQSPFNVGTRLALEDFTQEQVRALNELYGRPLASDRQIQQYHDLLNGQPYLTRRGLDELVREHRTLDQIIEIADRDEGVFGDHLRRILFALSNDPTLGRAVQALLRGEPMDGDSFYRLRAGGILRGDSPTSASFRCNIYETYLRKHLG